MPAASPSLRWLYLAVLGPLVLLAALAWIGIRTQLDAAWGNAREEAERIATKNSSDFNWVFSNSLRTAPVYPDPPIPGEPSPYDEILDGSDKALLLALRNDPDAGISPAGIPRRALAGLRMRHLQMEQTGTTLEHLLTITVPSVLTSRVLPELEASVETVTRWKLGERAVAISKEFPDAASASFWHFENDRWWWVWRIDQETHYVSLPKIHFPERDTPWFPENEDPFRFVYRTAESALKSDTSDLPSDAVLLAESILTARFERPFATSFDFEKAASVSLYPPFPASLHPPLSIQPDMAPHDQNFLKEVLNQGHWGAKPEEASRPRPMRNPLKLQVFAIPDILEAPIRRQQRWTLSILAAALLTATIALFTIHRTVARERHLADLKSQFVASVSHELRAPLGSIRLMAEALQQEKVRKPAEFHTLIAKEGARLSHLIENVLDFARIEEGRKHYHFEECDLTALLRDTLRLMQPIAEEREVHLTFDLAEITLTVDPAAIQQALVNLLDNAIKFSPPKGIVKLEVAGLPNQSVAITISDHGPGIPAKEHKNIFKRFHRLGNELRRETQGTGIGLSIVAHIAEAHNGTISVASTPPNGSIFTFTIPQSQGLDS